jgi:hypothetical protein
MLSDMNMGALAMTLLDGALEGGGITVDRDGLQTVRSSFVVGGVVPSLSIFRPVWGDHHGYRNAVGDIKAWLLRHYSTMPGHVFGSWDDGEGNIAFDFVTVLREEPGQDHDALADVAVALGRIRGEQAVGYINLDGDFAEELAIR